MNLKCTVEGRLGGSAGWAPDFGSGHDLTACEFKPRGGLCADSLDPGACSGSCVLLSYLPLCQPLCSHSVSQKSINIKKKKIKVHGGKCLKMCIVFRVDQTLPKTLSWRFCVRSLFACFCKHSLSAKNSKLQFIIVSLHQTGLHWLTKPFCFSKVGTF